nr:hypothetical protein C56G2.8 - Caenorhabditis elegans [Caenorhabditis elegans]
MPMAKSGGENEVGDADPGDADT